MKEKQSDRIQRNTEICYHNQIFLTPFQPRQNNHKRQRRFERCYQLSCKASAYNAGDPGLIPGLGRFPGEGNGDPLQYYCLENPTDGGAWWATVHGVAKSWTRLSDLTFTFTFHQLSLSSQVVQWSRIRLSVQQMEKTQVQSLGPEELPGEGNGNPLQYYCLENPTDGGAW